MKCSVFSPSHITGFFEIIDHQNPIERGSRGAGVCMDKGVLTHFRVNPDTDDPEVAVRINGKKDAKNASITFKTMELMIKEFKLHQIIGDKSLTIEHELEVPIGAGFGTSAACALGTALGMAKVLELPLTFSKAASMAHIAEVELKSGLGDVIAEVNGGLTLRLKEGAPGIGVTDKLIINNKVHGNVKYVIAKSIGGIETAEIIGSSIHKERINSTGRSFLNELLNNPYPKTFMQLSKRFAVETGLLSDEVSDIIEVLEDETAGASMAMLGNTAFALSETPDTSLKDAIISKIDFNGCRFV
jgi:pantoate kinase